MAEKQTDDLTNAMRIAFANTFAMYLKAHYYHWNVEGSDFYQYHSFFGDLYSEVYGAVDSFAEHIRAIGSYAPGSFKRLQSFTTIEDEEEVPAAVVMAERLLADNNTVYDSIKRARDLADAAGENGLVNYLEDRLDQHRKHGWMLKATIKRG